MLIISVKIGRFKLFVLEVEISKNYICKDGKQAIMTQERKIIHHVDHKTIFKTILSEYCYKTYMERGEILNEEK